MNLIKIFLCGFIFFAVVFSNKCNSQDELEQIIPEAEEVTGQEQPQQEQPQQQVPAELEIVQQEQPQQPPPEVRVQPQQEPAVPVPQKQEENQVQKEVGREENPSLFKKDELYVKHESEKKELREKFKEEERELYEKQQKEKEEEKEKIRKQAEEQKAKEKQQREEEKKKKEEQRKQKEEQKKQEKAKVETEKKIKGNINKTARQESRKNKKTTTSQNKERRKELSQARYAKRLIEAISVKDDPIYITDANVLNSKTSFLKIKDVEFRYRVKLKNQTPKIINSVLVIWERKIPFTDTLTIVRETTISKPMIPYEERELEYNELNSRRTGEAYRVKVAKVIFEDGTQWKNPGL